MHRFYFTTANGKRYPDNDGTVLPDLKAARVEAIKLTGELLQEFPERFWDTGSFTVEVADDRHLTLFTVDVSTIDAPAITGPSKPKT